ncbi:hypothetical protein BH11PSE4_BH11PSE4_02150 [soil metagenome]
MISLERFVRYRQFLFHATREENLDCLRSSREFFSAGLMKISPSALRKPRRDNEAASFSGSKILLGDHLPLRERNIDWQGDWNFQKLLGELDRRVFFFPAKGEDIPSDCDRFITPKIGRSLRMAVLRIPTRSLIEHNADAIIEFCKFNSGAPRASGGLKSPRGPQTFTSPQSSDFKVAQIREVTFLDSAKLPPETMFYKNTGWTSF